MKERYNIIIETLRANDIPQVILSYKPSKIGDKITGSGDAYWYAKRYWIGMEYYESMWCLLLNRTNRVIGFFEVGKGGVSGLVADPKLIFQSALLSNASGIILIHNHPSGNSNPSEADIKLCKRVKEGANLLDIEFLDNIIITHSSMKGFFEQFSEICEGLTVSLSISVKDGLITCSLVPMIGSKIIHPITVSGATGKEMDEQFVIELMNGLRLNKAKIQGVQEMSQSLDKTKERVKTSETKPVTSTSTKVPPKPEPPKKVEHQPGLDF